MTPREPEREPVRVEVTLPASLETVWQAFRDREHVKRWFGWEYEGLDDEVDLIFDEGTTVVEEGRALDIGGHLFEFEDRGDEVVVRVTRSSSNSMGWTPDYYFDIEEGWLSFLQQLRFALARHQHDPARRTLFFHGSPTTDDAPPLKAALGLSERRTPWGDDLAGAPWFTSEHQVGLTVDDWGDGLLIAYERPDRSTMVMITTYGLSEDDLAALGQRWSTWWAEHYAHKAG